jgi:hypothetical protein
VLGVLLGQLRGSLKRLGEGVIAPNGRDGVTHRALSYPGPAAGNPLEL